MSEMQEFVEQMDMLRDDFSDYSEGKANVPFPTVREAIVAALNSYDEVRAQLIEVRQLAEQRAELLADVERYRWLQMQTPYRFKKIQDAAAPGRDDDVRYFFKEVFDSAVDAAIANATQQRNATGGEG